MIPFAKNTHSATSASTSMNCFDIEEINRIVREQMTQETKRQDSVQFLFFKRLTENNLWNTVQYYGHAF